MLWQTYVCREYYAVTKKNEIVKLFYTLGGCGDYDTEWNEPEEEG